MNIKNSNLLAKYLPNTITILSLGCGLSSIRFSIINEWQIAILLIIFAAILDFFDGWFAKKLRGEGSFFGAELDSLSDVISFGVAPGLLIYLWSTYELNSLGWSATLFFVICSALRLARFTADIYLAPKNIDPKIYFVGVPSPAAAGLSLLPIFIFFQFNIELFENPYLNILNLFVIGFMMISKIPTFSFKSINLIGKFSPWIILIIVIMCIGILSNIWLSLVIISCIYILSIIYTVIVNLKSKH
tara:strand:+ start:3903 stop:4637 length:735 start_codon:yes stop_codon:yes gene_type:complete